MHTTTDNISKARRQAARRNMATPVIAACLVIALFCAYAAFFIPPLVEGQQRMPQVVTEAE